MRPWILDRALSAIARNSAIEIAQVCELKEIGGDLASLALDPTEHYRIRTAAARCIAETADGAIKARVKPLAIAQASDILVHGAGTVPSRKAQFLTDVYLRYTTILQFLACPSHRPFAVPPPIAGHGISRLQNTMTK